MLDPKEHVVAVGPKKGECYVCDRSLDREPSLQLQKQVPIIKKMASLGRVCLGCAERFGGLVVERIGQARKGEFQA